MMVVVMLLLLLIHDLVVVDRPGRRALRSSGRTKGRLEQRASPSRTNHGSGRVRWVICRRMMLGCDGDTAAGLPAAEPGIDDGDGAGADADAGVVLVLMLMLLLLLLLAGSCLAV